jgi:hypothetical protein
MTWMDFHSLQCRLKPGLVDAWIGKSNGFSA